MICSSLKVQKDNAISVFRQPRISANKVHAKSAFEFPSGFPEWSASREEEESPAAITRGESCHGETDETPFF
jgi:hypothetical protein